VLQSGNNTVGGYRARGFVWAYGQWNVGDSFGSLIGRLTSTSGAHYNVKTLWQFSTPIVYNSGKGVIVHELELVAVTGSVPLGENPMIGTDYSVDGVTWSQTRHIRAGRNGVRAKRLVWDRQGAFGNWRTQRFSGDSDAHLAFARLEAAVEELSV
jgi:hypothetical protein